MDTRTQEIRFFGDDEQAKAAGFNKKLTPAEAKHLLATPQNQRNAELERLRSEGSMNRKQARAQRAKQRKSHAKR